MNTDRLKNEINKAFAPYEELKPVSELKEELYRDLQEKLHDLRREGYDEETALRMTIESMGEISELVGAITQKGLELQHNIHVDIRASDMQQSDLSDITAQGRIFDFSNLRGSDFHSSDLRNSSFNCCNLLNANFNNANLSGAKITKSALKGATFNGATLDGADFRFSDLSGAIFDNQVLKGVNFNCAGLRGASFKGVDLIDVDFKTDLKRTVFDGARMDKLTYAMLKGYKADLSKAIIR